MSDQDGQTDLIAPSSRKIPFVELTLAKLIDDPLVSLVNKPDRVDRYAFRAILESAAQSRLMELGHPRDPQ
jgi:hypothetical protein